MMLVVALAAGLSGAAAEPPSGALMCNQMQPIEHDFAGMPWDVYGCTDYHSVALVAPPESEAAGAVFTFRWDNNAGYNLIGKSGRDRAASDAAYQLFSSFDADRIVWLYGETQIRQTFKAYKLVAGGEISASPQPPPPAFNSGFDTPRAKPGG